VDLCCAGPCSRPPCLRLKPCCLPSADRRPWRGTPARRSAPRADRPGRWGRQAKPADKSGNPWLHKLAVVPSRQLVQVSTAKKHIGSWLRLQVTADFDWETRRAGAHWKCVARRRPRPPGRTRVSRPR